MIDDATFRDLQAQAGADFVAELVVSFEEEVAHMLAELRRAAAAGAAESFRRTAHSIKSNASTFGATRLAEMARALELGGLPAGVGGSAAGPQALQPLADLEAECRRTIAALHALARR